MQSAQKHELMSLEMAEYEKTVADLQSRLHDLGSVDENQKDEIMALEEKLASQRDENRSVEIVSANEGDWLFYCSLLTNTRKLHFFHIAQRCKRTPLQLIA